MNEKDYETALSRIEQLKDAKAGTPEMDELVLLTAIVEMYEDRHFPISPHCGPPISPKPTLTALLSFADVYALAEKLKIHPAIMAGKIRFEQNNYKLLSRHVGNKQIRKQFAESFIANDS